jgi:hypothetical protein
MCVFNLMSLFKLCAYLTVILTIVNTEYNPECMQIYAETSGPLKNMTLDHPSLSLWEIEPPRV